MKISTKYFGLGASLITLTNEKGVSISFTNLGARVVDWIIDDKHVLLGFESAQEYLEKDSYPGATIGRTAGRIKDGLVKVAGQQIQLNQNEFPQTLHGGEDSFDKKLWRYDSFNDGDLAGVHFYLTSNDGENGYPGKLDLVVTHSFDEHNNWQIDYQAVSDKDTVFNPTGHAYFNLTGDASQAIDAHCLWLAADRFVPLLDGSEVVRGNIEKCAGEAFDFSQAKRLAEVFASDDEQVQLVGGIDHPFLLNELGAGIEQARLTLDDLSLSVFTDRPSIVIFTANFGNKGTIYRGKTQVNHGGITFETQVSPGSEQIPELGNISLKAGENYHSQTIYKLTKKEK